MPLQSTHGSSGVSNKVFGPMYSNVVNKIVYSSWLSHTRGKLVNGIVAFDALPSQERHLILRSLFYVSSLDRSYRLIGPEPVGVVLAA